MKQDWDSDSGLDSDSMAGRADHSNNAGRADHSDLLDSG